MLSKRSCNSCGSSNFEQILDLGVQESTGHFPKSFYEKIPASRLKLLRCLGDCGLTQLSESLPPAQLYGNRYGYRSSLNSEMVDHLAYIKSLVGAISFTDQDDLIVDVGSNDGTLLNIFANSGYRNLVGIDPTIAHIGQGYAPIIQKIPKFFAPVCVRGAKVITSIAMFYDLEEPVEFAQQVYDSLDDEGIWVLEVNYFPVLMQQGIYDFVCHEHISYFSMQSLSYIFDKVGFKIVNAQFTQTNGGSILLALRKRDSYHPSAPMHGHEDVIKNELLAEERDMNLTYGTYQEKVNVHKRELRDCLKFLTDMGSTVYGYGASTKGNVVIQYADLHEFIPYIVDINPDKHGCYTPGNRIPIIPEVNIREDIYYLAFPWHFRKQFEVKNPGRHFIYPFHLDKVTA